MINVEKYINKRNAIWESNNAIPKWVDVKNVDLDQFFTKVDVAKNCYKKLLEYLSSKNVSIDDCLFVEPSAGAGAFFNLLPEKQRIGLDICPMNKDIIEQEFLSWKTPQTDKKIVVIGSGLGKTSFIKRYLEGDIGEDFGSTVIAHCYVKTIKFSN